MSRPALLLIAHGSRSATANADLHAAATALAGENAYAPVVASFLELAEPSIDEGGAQCVAAGATDVVMMPYFLSAGVHVRRDLKAARERLAERFPDVRFHLAEPLGPHPLLLAIVRERVSASYAT